MKNVGAERYIIRAVACSSAFLALMGTGFGAWVFTQQDEPSQLAAPIEMETAINYTDFAIATSGTLTLDDAGSTFEDCTMTVTTQADIICGLLLEQKVDSKGNYLYDDDGNPEYGVDESRKLVELDLHYTITCSMSSALKHYVYCKNIYTDSDKVTITCKTEDPTVEDEDTLYEVTSKNEDANGFSGSETITDKFTLHFAWNNHPKSTEEFKEMQTEMKEMKERVAAGTEAEPICFTVKLNGSASTVRYE